MKHIIFVNPKFGLNRIIVFWRVQHFLDFIILAHDLISLFWRFKSIFPPRTFLFDPFYFYPIATIIFQSHYCVTHFSLISNLSYEFALISFAVS